MKARTRKDTLGPADLVALLGPIIKESKPWAEAVRSLLQGDGRPFEAMAAREAAPPSVQPVIRRMAEGKSMKLDGRPRARPFEDEVKVWSRVMYRRLLPPTEF